MGKKRRRRRRRGEIGDRYVCGDAIYGTFAMSDPRFKALSMQRLPMPSRDKKRLLRSLLDNDLKLDVEHLFVLKA